MKRKEIEKYSHCATLQEIKENDYNLNIPRYVDTFEEEEEIDIHAVMTEIKELEAKQRQELDKQDRCLFERTRLNPIIFVRYKSSMLFLEK